MANKEEFGYLVNEFESLRDMFLEEIAKVKTELENLKQDFEDLKKELSGSGRITIKRRLG